MILAYIHPVNGKASDSLQQSLLRWNFSGRKKEYVWFEPTELLVQNRAITIGNFRNGDALDRWISVYS